jgi:hypothetical protein
LYYFCAILLLFITATDKFEHPTDKNDPYFQEMPFFFEKYAFLPFFIAYFSWVSWASTHIITVYALLDRKEERDESREVEESLITSSYYYSWLARGTYIA